MFEKVNPSHPDKIADRIAGHIVDMAYAKQENPEIAVEVLIGHNECKIVIEADKITCEEIREKSTSICDFINRITKEKVDTTFKICEQDTHLADNQKEKIKCGDNGIFRGVPTTEEQYLLTGIVEDIYYNNVREDGKYVLANTQYGNTLIACQSYVEDETKFMTRIKEYVKATKGTIDFYNINPIGAWTGGINVDTGAVNRKLGSDMGYAITGGGLHGKNLSKADVSVNIYCHLIAHTTGQVVEAFCSIGATDVNVKVGDKQTQVPYSQIVALARDYVFNIVGGFEKLAEWGLIR